MGSVELTPWAGLTLDLVSFCNDLNLVGLVCGSALLRHCGQWALAVRDTALPCQLCPQHLLSHLTSLKEQPALTPTCQPHSKDCYPNLLL